MQKLTLILTTLATLLLALALPHAAGAVISFDEARASCIARIRPQVIRCVAHHMIARGGPPRMYIAQCREPAAPHVRACVMRTLRDGGHPLLVGRPLPGPDAICPLGFDGCMHRCHRVGGWGGAAPAQTCGRVCARRCAPGFAARGETLPEATAAPVAQSGMMRDWVGGY
jgi:hypothetical protein